MASRTLQSHTETYADSSGTIPAKNFEQFLVWPDLRVITISASVASGTWDSETATCHFQELGEDGTWYTIKSADLTEDGNFFSLFAQPIPCKNMQNPRAYRFRLTFSPGSGTISLPVTLLATATGS